MAKHDVTFQHSAYQSAVLRWSLVDDCSAGSEKIKAARETYLPQPNPLDESDEAKRRYDDYVTRSVFYNVTGRTLQGLNGAVFRKKPEAALPESISYAEDDIDGAGVGLIQQAQLTVKQVLKKGRRGLLVDYPSTASPVSKAAQEALGIRATIAAYDAESIINWRVSRSGGLYKLSLVVLFEQVSEQTEDGFGSEPVEQYRVLRLTDGIYTQEVWRKNSSNGNWSMSINPFSVLKNNGQPWNEIPFTFVGAQNNDTTVDESPLYDLAVMNIAHYRNSAENEDTTFMCGQVQPVVTGVDEGWVKLLKEEGVKIGSRTLFPLPKDGSFEYVQADPNTLPSAGMKHKEEQMMALGAQLIIKGGQAITATQSNHDAAKDYSVLSLAAENVSKAYTKCFGWMLGFMGGAGKASVELNQDFIEHSLDAQLLTALIGAWQSGQLPDSDLWAQLRKYGLIAGDKTDEDIKDELETSGAGIGLENADE